MERGLDHHEPEEDRTESPEATLARTQRLLARSRATLERLARRLAGDEGDAEDEPPLLPGIDTIS
jgi:hypothetical protein